MVQQTLFSFATTAKEAVLNYHISGLNENVDTMHVIGTIIGENADLLTCATLKEIGLRNLMDYTVEQFINEGLTEDEAIKLHASFLLTKRLIAEKKNESYIIRSPEDGANYVMEELKYQNQEHFVVLFLNTKNEVITKKTIFVGSLNASIVHPREIFREAVKLSSASIILTHNHPSGNSSPSQEDIQVTKRLVEVGKMIGIEVLDHLIIGEHKFVSLKEKGYI